MGQEVTRTVTPVSVADAAQYVRAALTELLGRVPNRALALFVLALAWVETGRGRSVQNYSPGNVMARGIRAGKEYSVWSGDYWRPTWWDAEWKNAAMREGKAPSAFRAYPNFTAGFRDYVSAVVKRAALVAAMSAGDPLRVALALNSTKYSPDYNASHAKTFGGLVSEFRKQGLFADLPESSSGGMGAVVGCVALVFVGVGLALWRAHR